MWGQSTRIIAGLAAIIVLVGVSRASANPAPLAPRAAADNQGPWHIQGPISAMNGEFWDVGGFVIRVASSTRVTGGVPAIGTPIGASGIVQPDGTWLATDVEVVGSGDATATATPSPSATVVPLAGTGAFVVGDRAATAGNRVTFWGAGWSAANPLSGGSAPASFKGFADDLSATPPSCGATWSAQPGDSAAPPASVPTLLPVIVASEIDRNGSTIGGDVREIVLVQTDPGYAPDPGHPGTGTVVGVLCTLATATPIATSTSTPTATATAAATSTPSATATPSATPTTRPGGNGNQDANENQSDNHNLNKNQDQAKPDNAGHGPRPAPKDAVPRADHAKPPKHHQDKHGRGGD